MPGAAESSLCISEKCCYEWSHAYSALVDVMTEWGVTKWSVTVLTHNSMHLPIFTRRDRAPRTEHNKIKHIQAACRTGWGSSVMERNAGAKTTVMDLHLHESCSFPPCIFRRADWSCAMSQIKSTLAWEWARGSQEVVEKNSTWLVAGPNKVNKLNSAVLMSITYKSPVLYHLMSRCLSANVSCHAHLSREDISLFRRVFHACITPHCN